MFRNSENFKKYWGYQRLNDSIYKELFISFVTISAILALALGLTIFIIIKYKILGKKSIEFNKFDNEMDNITQS